MKNLKLTPFLTFFFLLLFSFSSFSQILWEKKASHPDQPRRRVSSFVIGDYLYCGGGLLADGTTTKDWWSYHPATDTWDAIQEFPGDGRHCAVGFSDGQYGYVGMGYGPASDNMQDFWKYDPVANEWIQISDIPDSGKWWASGVCGDDKCYVAFGGNSNTNQYSNDIWQYTPSTDSWSLLTELENGPRFSGVIFLLDNKIYTGLGGSFGERYRDFWEYDIGLNKWKRKKDFPTEKTNRCGTFNIEGQLYVMEGTGTTVEIGNGEHLYRYNVEEDTWDRESDFIGLRRSTTLSGVVNGKGYYGLGINHDANVVLKDLYQLELVKTPYEKDFSITYEEECPPLKVHFEDVGTESTAWFWVFQGGTPKTSFSKSPTITYTEAGFWNVSLVVNTLNGPAYVMKEKVVEARGAPIATFTYDQIDNTFDFTNTSTWGESFLWDFADGNTSTEENPTHTYNSVGNYLVRFSTFNECGERGAVAQISVESTAVVELGKEIQLEVNPNPSSGVFNVSYRFEESVKDGKMVLLDVTGKQVLSKRVKDQEGVLIIDETLPPGVYFLRLENEEIQSQLLKLIRVE